MIAATLLEVSAGHKHLGAEIGFLSVLHTWGQTLQQIPTGHDVHAFFYIPDIPPTTS